MNEAERPTIEWWDEGRCGKVERMVWRSKAWWGEEQDNGKSGKAGQPSHCDARHPGDARRSMRRDGDVALSAHPWSTTTTNKVPRSVRVIPLRQPPTVAPVLPPPTASPR